MTTSAEIKQWAFNLGADLCGIASVERFSDAPVGFHPRDVYPGTQSVIVIAIREHKSSLYATSPVPYTFSSSVALQKIFGITYDLISKLEERKIIAIAIPSEPYEYWDAENTTGKGILSLKHAAHLVGLGVIGRNTLLVNRKFGNLIRLSAIITNVQLDSDPIENFEFCTDACNLCINSCPGGAIGHNSVNQKKCRPNSSVNNKKGESLYVCNNCRKVCPYLTGFA